MLVRGRSAPTASGTPQDIGGNKECVEGSPRKPPGWEYAGSVAERRPAPYFVPLVFQLFPGHTVQSVCPWNVKFSQALAEDSPFRAREFVAGKDAVTLATDILALDQDAFIAAFRNSPMKRAKLAGLRRNAAVVLRNTYKD